MATSKTPADETASTGDYVVAPGRTVQIDGKDHGPGSSVTLDKAEGDYLQGRGFFIAEDGSVSVSTSGPSVNQEDGVSVTES